MDKKGRGCVSEEVRICHIENEQEARAFGLALAEQLQPGDVLALVGDLGVGKTTLTRYIAEGLGVTERVSSPTYQIVREYRSGRLPLFHFDVYRLESIEEFRDLGVEAYFEEGGISVIEWADLVDEALPESSKLLLMERGERDEERIYRCAF